MASLIEILDEQAVFGFTGRINIILKSNRQYLGVITQREGHIVDAQYKELLAQRALWALIIDDLSGEEKHSYIVEPEVVEPKDETMKLSIREAKREAARIYEQWLESQKLRPPGELRLLINSDFVIEGQEVNANEFKVLALLTEYNKVSDLYRHATLLDYELTNSLVSLRKKGALKVFKTT